MAPRGRRFGGRLDERPVDRPGVLAGGRVRPGRTLVDPAPDHLDLFRGEPGGLLRHPDLVVALHQPLVEEAFAALTRQEGLPRDPALERGRPGIEAELPLLLRRGVAGDAVLSQDRADVAREVDRGTVRCPLSLDGRPEQQRDRSDSPGTHGRTSLVKFPIMQHCC